MSTQAVPTQRQLQYLRTLAARTATTFATPRTRREASRQIDRLLALARSEIPPPHDTDPREQQPTGYAPRIRADEVTGFGSSARWQSRSPGRSGAAAAADFNPSRPIRLGSYRVRGGRRVLIAKRTADAVDIEDVPAGASGASYSVERLSADEGSGALSALLGDYLKRAAELDEIPMSEGALEQMFGVGAGR